MGGQNMTNENAIKQLKRMKMDKSHTGDEYNAIMTAIKALEQEPKTGHWKHNKCDVCGASRPPLFNNYCPNCGAKMVEPQESEECRK
jgi:uncharacterized OB-fold protein